MQKRFLTVSKQAHDEEQKELLKRKLIKSKQKFNSDAAKESQEYMQIKVERQYLYGYVWSPPIADHFQKNGHPVSQADMASMKGKCGGVLFGRYVWHDITCVIWLSNDMD